MAPIFKYSLNLICTLLLVAPSNVLSRSDSPNTRKTRSAESLTPVRSPEYAGSPNHRDIAVRALELALLAGFNDTVGISLANVRSRLETGAYGEDYDMIPGIVGEHFPDPWNQGPEFDFNGLYPFSRIPYGSLTDASSGWARGMPHGYDPVQGFTWPGTDSTTVGWANALTNGFSWTNALALYRQGKKADAYECVGHLIHLLSDLSVPEHVKIVDHGMSVTRKNSGTAWDPDLVSFVVDEYELALAGGIELPGVIKLIPDMLGIFRTALTRADTAGIPRLGSWNEYFTDLARFTYDDSLVNRYYGAPAVNGMWGARKKSSGTIVDPTTYGITPPAPVAGRWSQIVLKSTASISGGTVMPESAMVELCNRLVPEAAEYSAGLLLKFLADAQVVQDVGETGRQPAEFRLDQNFPNPFNPSTTIEYRTATRGRVSLRVYDILGREVATLVNEVEAPGKHSVTWNAGNLAGGVYLCRVEAGSSVGIRKMILLK